MLTTLSPTLDPTTPQPPARNALERFLEDALKDPRDLAYLRLAIEATVVVPPVTLLFFLDVLPLWLTAVWLPIGTLRYGGPYAVVMHVNAHRPMFKRSHRWLKWWITWFVAPFLGQTPNAYPSHHIGMHHVEDNGDDDVSSTRPYRRDSLLHFMHYIVRFVFFAWLHTPPYLLSRRRRKLARKLLLGEGAWLAAFVLLFAWSPGPAILLWAVPLVLGRSLTMVSNWAQHAFIDPDRPDDPVRNTTILRNAACNIGFFNDGYHAVHHLKPMVHYTDMPTFFEDNLYMFAERDAFVFEGIAGSEVVWWCLMTGDYDRLAHALVDLPTGPQRTHAEKVAHLRRAARVRCGPWPKMLTPASPWSPVPREA